MDHFVKERDFCLVFKLLNKCLHDVMKKRRCVSLRVAETRVVTQQMLVAFKALKHVGVKHCDLKTRQHNAGESLSPLKSNLLIFVLPRRFPQ